MMFVLTSVLLLFVVILTRYPEFCVFWFFGFGFWGLVWGSLWVGGVIPDVHERLVPPRILEKFTPKKVKRGSSITFSVKVEGEVTHRQDDSYP